VLSEQSLMQVAMSGAAICWQTLPECVVLHWTWYVLPDEGSV